MNFEICEEFKEHFYDVHQFHYLDENKRVNLKFSWVLKTIARKNDYWRKYYFTRFIDTLPRCYRITVPELFNRYIEVGKSSFIEALYEQTQQNAKAEGRNTVSTENTSKNIGVELLKLRLEKIHSDALFCNMPYNNDLHSKNYKKALKGISKKDKNFWRKRLKASEKTMSYFTADKDFIFKMMLLLGTTCVEEGDDSSFFNIRVVTGEKRDIDYEDALEIGESIFFEQFLDGVGAKYKNEALLNVRKTKKALDFLGLDPYAHSFDGCIGEACKTDIFFYPKGGWNSDRWNLNNHITKKKMGSSVRAAQAYKEKDNLSKKSEQTEKTYCEVLPGDRIGVSSMIGASKLISKYRKFFDAKDIDFLLHRKKYSGERTELRPTKKFYLDREDQDKYNHLLDKNDHIIFPC